MTERLTLERFGELADAYGGVVARWPETYRSDAMVLAAQPDAARILADALGLDEALDHWSVAPAAAELQARLALAAPKAGRGLVVRAQLWWSGIGFAAALAGAAAGAIAVAYVAPVDTSAESSTSFGDIAGQES